MWNPPFPASGGLYLMFDCKDALPFCQGRYTNVVEKKMVKKTKEGGETWRKKNTRCVHASEKVNQNCQKVYTDCKDVNTKTKLKKEVKTLRQHFFGV
jgi:hypothetical protein